MKKAAYPALAVLDGLLQSHAVRLEPSPAYLGSPSFRAVQVHANAVVETIYVDNEYGDLDAPTQAMCLCLVLQAIDAYREAPDYLVWCRELELDPANERLRTYYLGLRTGAIPLADRLAWPRCPISDYDWSLNAGAAQALRSLSRDAGEDAPQPT